MAIITPKRFMQIIYSLIRAKKIKLLFKLPYVAALNIIKDKISKRLTLGIGQLLITNKCTLKCENCTSLIHHYTNQHDLHESNVINDFDAFIKHIDFVYTIHVLGGEPFLHRSLDLIIRHIAQYKNKYGLLQVITNGTIIPSEKVLHEIKTFLMRNKPGNLITAKGMHNYL